MRHGTVGVPGAAPPLGTYRPQPEGGHPGMTIGLSHIRDEHRVDRLAGMLWLPLQGRPGPYPLGHRGEESAQGAPPIHRTNPRDVHSAD